MTKFQLSRWIGSAVLGVTALVATDVHADVKLPNIFSDGMVLQQGQENKVWGKDNPGQAITLTIGDKKLTATADASGNWQAKLPAMQVGGEYTLTVAGRST